MEVIVYLELVNLSPKIIYYIISNSLCYPNKIIRNPIDSEQVENGTQWFRRKKTKFLILLKFSDI